MRYFLYHLYWKIRFLFTGAPTKAEIDAKLARVTAIHDAELTARTAQPRCDCAVYTSAGAYVECLHDIFEYQCHAIAGDGVETNILPVGGCAAVPHASGTTR